jgi:hypothetical protein
MKITVERSGGFAGMLMRSQVDSSQLSPQDSQELQGLIDAVHFFDLPPQVKIKGAGADRFQFTITVEDGGKRNSVTGSETDLPEGVTALIHRVTMISRNQSR